MRRFVVLALAGALVAGCSNTVTAVPSPSPTDAGLTVATQRLEAQAAMAVHNGIQTASLLAVVLNTLGPLERGSAATPPTCKNGVEIAVTPITPESFDATVGVFYDPACTHILSRAKLKAILTPPSSLAVTGTATRYDRAGHPVGYDTIANHTTITPGSTHGVTRGTISATPSGPPILTFGLTCTLATKNVCGFGGVVNLSTQSQSLGVAATLSNFVASGKANDGTVSLNGFAGAAGTLKLNQGTGNAWIIAGGALAASLRGTFAEDVNAAAFSVDGSLNLKDTLLNATTTEKFGSRSGVADGVVSETTSGKSFATFSANAIGSGTIDYSDGSKGKIVLFFITS